MQAASPNSLPVTERLSLRRFTPEDLDLLCRMYADEEVARYVGGVKDRAKVQEMLDQRILAYYDSNPGLGVWATLDRASGACVGMHLLNHIQGESFIQVGYVLFREQWGRGYATEMSVALLRYGFETLRLPQIVAITNLPNVSSQRVLLKAGLRRNGERAFAHPAYADQGALAWFERDAADWLAEFGCDDDARAAGETAALG
jgi:RimJ/RimL family protein N-acetyltransferase